MITYDFPPSTAMGAQACAQLARYLPLYGWEPVVLTVRESCIEHRDASAQPVLPPLIIRTGVIPHPLTIYQRLKPGPRAGAEEGAHHGQPPAQRGAAASAERGVLRRWALSLLTIPDTCSGWIPPAVIAGLDAVRKHRVDQIFSSAPHSTNHLVGLALSHLTGLPWTAHFRDPWVYPSAQWRQSKPLSALSARIETKLERMVVRRANVVACVTEQHASWLRHLYPDLPSGKLVTIPNGFDGAEWEALGSAGNGSHPMSHETFVITYAGSLYLLRSPLPLFRALSSLIQAGEVARDRVRVDLIGRCDVADGAGVREMAAALGLTGCVNITGPLGRAETLRRVAHSDLLLLLAEELIYQVPGKTYEYLRAGRPILALASAGAVADLLRRTGGAWVVDPANEAAVTAAVREAYRRWKDGLDGPRPDPDVVARFDRRVLVGRLAEVFETAAASRRVSR
jgi:glycosyltransferase involved in cell wall biosynthesis